MVAAETVTDDDVDDLVEAVYLELVPMSQDFLSPRVPLRSLRVPSTSRLPLP